MLPSHPLNPQVQPKFRQMFKLHSLHSSVGQNILLTGTSCQHSCLSPPGSLLTLIDERHCATKEMSSFKTILPARGRRSDKKLPLASKSTSKSSQLHSGIPSGGEGPTTAATGGRGHGGSIRGSEVGSEPLTGGEEGGEDEEEAEEEDDDEEDEKKPKRKRKVKGKVAVIACSECRRTRSKCDGEVPNPCSRCRSRGFHCVYQPHTKIQKDDLLHGLTQEKALTASLSQRNHELSMILQVISSDGHLDEIVQRLRRKEEAKSIAAWLSSLPELQLSQRRKSLVSSDIEEIVRNLQQTYNVPVSVTHHSHHSSPPVSPSAPSEESPLSRPKWTRVTTNLDFLDHLVKLYLDCIHPSCMLFNEITFLQDYRTGGSSACSRPLLDAICAMACNLLDRKYLISEEDASNVADLHNAFLAEARASISLVNSQNLTTIQAMAIMYLIDLSNGKARSANTYLKCAAESLRSVEREENSVTADFELTRWGVCSLEM